MQSIDSLENFKEPTFQYAHCTPQNSVASHQGIYIIMHAERYESDEEAET